MGATDFLTKPVDAVEFLARVRNMLELRRSQKSLQDRAAWLAAEVAKATAEIRAREHEIILRLSRAAEFRDQETGDHTVRVGRYAQLISARLGFSEEDQEILLRAAPMHDIGKVGVPDHVLLKAGPLTSEERAVMEQHTVIGYHILRGSASSLLQRAAEIALSHHEKWDGTGYPNGWAGEKIPILGRIVAVADVFDALSTRRPYRPAWDVERAGSYLQENRGTHFDVRCVEAFLDGWDEMLRIRAEIAEPHGPLAAVRAPLLAAAAGRMAHAS